MIQKLTNKLNDRKKGNKGFTLVELIVVIVILAILAAILIPGLLKWIDEAKDKQYELEARSIFMATQAEMAENYGKGTALSDLTLQTESELKRVRELSGLDVSSVDATITDSKITDFTTTFISSNENEVTENEVTMHWTADTQAWEKLEESAIDATNRRYQSEAGRIYTALQEALVEGHNYEWWDQWPFDSPGEHYLLAPLGSTQEIVEMISQSSGLDVYEIDYTIDENGIITKFGAEFTSSDSTKVAMKWTAADSTAGTTEKWEIINNLYSDY